MVREFILWHRRAPSVKHSDQYVPHEETAGAVLLSCSAVSALMVAYIFSSENRTPLHPAIYYHASMHRLD